MNNDHIVNVHHLNMYANELAGRMRKALNIADGMINFQECLKVVDAVEQIGQHLTLLNDQSDEFDALALREKFNIKHMSAARILQRLLKHPDMLQSQQDLADTINCSTRSIPVYMSHLRHALNLLDLNDVVHVSYRSGYYITAHNVARIRNMVVDDGELIAKAA